MLQFLYSIFTKIDGNPSQNNDYLTFQDATHQENTNKKNIQIFKFESKPIRMSKKSI